MAKDLFFVSVIGIFRHVAAYKWWSLGPSYDKSILYKKKKKHLDHISAVYSTHVTSYTSAKRSCETSFLQTHLIYITRLPFFRSSTNGSVHRRVKNFTVGIYSERLISKSAMERLARFGRSNVISPDCLESYGLSRNTLSNHYAKLLFLRVRSPVGGYDTRLKTTTDKHSTGLIVCAYAVFNNNNNNNDNDKKSIRDAWPQCK